MSRPTDDRLDAVLASVGAHLDVEPRRRSPRRAPLTIAAGGVLVAVVAVSTIAPARRVVGGWLRIGSIEISSDVDLPADVDELPSFVTDQQPIARHAVERRLGTAVPEFAAGPLGEPDAWLAPDAGGVVAVWAASETSLWILDTVGNDAWFDKQVGGAEQVTELPALGDGGAMVSGEHVLRTPGRTDRSDTVVIWVDGALLLRLESGGLDESALIAAAGWVAATIDP